MTPLRPQVLAAIVACPGELTAADIARQVLPLPEDLRIRQPFRSPEHRRSLVAAREEWERQAVGRVSNAIGELVRAGLVEKLRPPTVAEWFRARMTSRGTWAALRDFDRLHDVRVSDATIDAWAAMVEAHEQSPGSWRPGKSGAEQQSYQQLVALGVFVAPGQRWPTEAGMKR